MATQTSIQVTDATRAQVEALGRFGNFTSIVRIAVDRMYREECKPPTNDQLIVMAQEAVGSWVFEPDNADHLDTLAGLQAILDGSFHYTPGPVAHTEDWDGLRELGHNIGADMEGGVTEARARQRVADTPELEAHSDTIYNDWSNWDDHMQWIATAPVAEIVEWAETVEDEFSDDE